MKARVVKNEAKPESTEILAEAVVRIGDSFLALKQSGLNERAIVVLVAEASGESRTSVKNVLTCLAQLRGYYCR